jgi:hypothetical protein
VGRPTLRRMRGLLARTLANVRHFRFPRSRTRACHFRFGHGADRQCAPNPRDGKHRYLARAFCLPIRAALSLPSSEVSIVVCLSANTQLLTTRFLPRPPSSDYNMPFSPPTCTNVVAVALQLVLLAGNVVADDVVFGKPATFDYVGKSTLRWFTHLSTAWHDLNSHWRWYCWFSNCFASIQGCFSSSN